MTALEKKTHESSEKGIRNLYRGKFLRFKKSQKLDADCLVPLFYNFLSPLIFLL